MTQCLVIGGEITADNLIIFLDELTLHDSLLLKNLEIDCESLKGNLNDSYSYRGGLTTPIYSSDYSDDLSDRLLDYCAIFPNLFRSFDGRCGRCDRPTNNSCTNCYKNWCARCIEHR